MTVLVAESVKQIFLKLVCVLPVVCKFWTSLVAVVSKKYVTHIVNIYEVILSLFCYLIGKEYKQYVNASKNEMFLLLFPL